MGSLCGSSTAKPLPPNLWDNATTKEKTDNYNKMMGRTWYL